MQCELSKEELTELDMAVMARGITCKLSLQEGKGDKEKLEAKIREIDALHYKLVELMGITRDEIKEFL